MMMKICVYCKEHLPIECFSKHRREKDGLSTWCRKCRSAHRSKPIEERFVIHKNRHRLNEVSEVDAAYIAGFFDGEGCVSLGMHNKRSTTGRGYHYLRVFVANTNLEVLEWLSKTLGFGHPQPQKKKEGQRQVWRYMLSGVRAISFLEIVYPYLQVKKNLAEIAFRFSATRKTTFGSPLRSEAIKERNKLMGELRVVNSPNGGNSHVFSSS